MRQLRADVSHRMRRRRPSIFSVTWFRLALGAGVAVILGLVLGPAVAAWLRGSAGPGPVPLDLAGTSVKSEARTSPTGGAEPASTVSAASPSSPPVNPPAPPEVADTAKADPRSRPGLRGLFRVQVGAFLDHRNADRLMQRLRAENFEVADTIVEQSRVLYRVLARPRDEEGYDEFLERLRGLGFDPETTDGGALVTAPVPLHVAVEASRRLRESDVGVRLERATSAAAFRVVRVGRFESPEDAERMRVELAGRGIEGFVVREQ